jgi:hypothetical protein
MVEAAQLTRPRIRRQVGDASIAKAKAYTRNHVWSGLRSQGPTLRGYCQGRAAAPYRVEVTFDGDEITRADCTCPVGGGGHCKHVAALLLYYRDHPRAFAEVEDLEAALERRSKGELVALIRRMVRRVPDLELLLEAPLPGVNGTTADDPEPYRRQALAAFGHTGDSPAAAAGIARELRDIAATGDEFRDAGDPAAAAAVYRGVAGAALERLDAVDDENGDILDVVAGCAAGLCRCLEATPPADAGRRRELLRSLFDLYADDEAHGGLGVSDVVPETLLHETTPEERHAVAEWVRERLPRGQGWCDDYRRRVFADLLLGLEADTLDDKAYLRICRETGQTDALVERLLSLGRRKEALREIAKVEDHDLLPLTDLLVQHALADDAETLVRDRLERSPDDLDLLAWLKQKAQDRGDAAEALALAGRLFRLRPSQDGYEEVRRLTGPRDWPAHRAELLTWLERRRNDWLLIPIYLKEREVGKALAVLRSDWGRSSGRKLDVARAAEKDYPREALAIYGEYAEGLIEQRNREAYRAACEHLRKVRDLRQRLGEPDAWVAYIADLRERFRPLRALREELDQAGL